jgi:dihydrolipoamide dehydrogenase
MRSYDLAIIGSGPGGYIAALYASRLKMKVCVIEKDLLGGTCLNRGCIPTKVMLNSASILSQIKSARQHGIDVGEARLDFPAVSSRKNEVVTRLRAGIETLFRAGGINLIKGSARISGPNSIKIDSKDEISAENIIIAAGSRPLALPGITIDETDIYSSDGILMLAKLPKSILIIGGGAIGAEFASLFNAFGVKVTIVELLERLIPMQSREASRKLETIFKKRGIDVITGSKVEAIEKKGGLKIKLSGNREIESEKALVSVGRRPAIEGLGCEDLGIRIENGKIVVDKNLKTSIKNIYAIGDCVEGPQLAHKASYDGILACDNIAGNARKTDYSNIPNCIYTDPEVASVGLVEETAKEKFPEAKVAKFPYLASGKAYLLGKSEGFIKLIGDPKGNILGVEIMGEGACDLIGEAVIARSAGMNIKDLAHAVHGHPTLSEIIQEAAHIFTGTPIHSI